MTHIIRSPDMEFVKHITLLDFQVKNLTPSISPNFNSLSKKKHKKWVKMEKFTPLTKILHWRHGQIPPLILSFGSKVNSCVLVFTEFPNYGQLLRASPTLENNICSHSVLLDMRPKLDCRHTPEIPQGHSPISDYLTTGEGGPFGFWSIKKCSCSF